MFRGRFIYKKKLIHTTKQNLSYLALITVRNNINMGILEIIAIVLLVLWVGGLLLHIAGGLIHILLVIAIILFAWRFIKAAF